MARRFLAGGRYRAALADVLAVEGREEQRSAAERVRENKIQLPAFLVAGNQSAAGKNGEYT